MLKGKWCGGTVVWTLAWQAQGQRFESWQPRTSKSGFIGAGKKNRSVKTKVVKLTKIWIWIWIWIYVEYEVEKRVMIIKIPRQNVIDYIVKEPESRYFFIFIFFNYLFIIILLYKCTGHFANLNKVGALYIGDCFTRPAIEARSLCYY